MLSNDNAFYLTRCLVTVTVEHRNCQLYTIQQRWIVPLKAHIHMIHVVKKHGIHS